MHPLTPLTSFIFQACYKHVCEVYKYENTVAWEIAHQASAVQKIFFTKNPTSSYWHVIYYTLNFIRLNNFLQNYFMQTADMCLFPAKDFVLILST